MTRQQHINDEDRNGFLRDERGAAMIMVTVSIVAMFAFAVLAIELAILMTVRTQLHTAADAAALAGASGFAAGGQAEATARAMSYASYNWAVQDTMRPATITADDVTFPELGVIRVQTHRTVATGDPIRTYFLRVLNAANTYTADMTAVAAARVFGICGSDCLKPWAIPDRWDDADSSGTYTMGEYYDPDSTGYQAPRDVGLSIVLKVGNPGQAIAPGVFFPVNFPPIGQEPGPLTGGSWYETWIGECSPYLVNIGDSLQIEPGNMVGPTIAGMEDLIALDPTAVWDPVSKQIVNSAYVTSPRIGLIPFFDPRLAPDPGRSAVYITKIGAVFIESTGPGSRVQARFISVTSPGVPCEGPGAGLVSGIVLIE